MLLTCDIGNTNIKTGIFTDDRLTEFHFFQEITSLSVLIKKNKYRDIVVSSVVPSKTQKLTDNLSDLNLNRSVRGAGHRRIKSTSRPIAPGRAGARQRQPGGPGPE